MNQARALQVLNDIHNTVAVIESECERLCILINECRDNQYWKIQYTSEQQWALATFSSISAFRHLASIADAYRSNIGLITELGRSKAEALIPVMRKHGYLNHYWKDKASELSQEKLDNFVHTHGYPSRRSPRCEEGILKKDIRNLQERIALYHREIDRMQARLDSKLIQLQKLKQLTAA